MKMPNALNIAYIWYEPSERSLVEERFGVEEPTWTLKCIPEHTVCNLSAILRLLKSGHDAILVHLSLRYCLALKMAEIAHVEDLKTKIVLFSRTVSEVDSIRGFFDGHINPDRDIGGLTRRISDLVSAKRNRLTHQRDIEQRIVTIFNSSDTLKSAYLAKFKIRHKHNYTIEDFHRAIGASKKPDWEFDTAAINNQVFLSYSHADRDVASEIARLLQDKGISTFMAERSIQGGDDWESEIRQAILSAREVLLLLTPNSVASNWVMVEAGAAWSLGKRLTPCVAFIDLHCLPEPISAHQARSIATTEDKHKLVSEIVSRLGREDSDSQV